MSQTTGNPDEASRLAREWGVRLTERISGSTCSDVYATSNGLVLKVPHVGSEERDAAWAVRSFSENGGITPLECDDETGALLMPRLGMNLSEAPLDEDEKVRICSDLTLRLRQTPNDRRSIDFSTWFAEPDPGSPALEHEAWREVCGLLDTSPEPALLHGDLHHFNIMQGDSGWVAIDPKGMSGDPAYEPCAYMRNPIGGLPEGDLLVDFMRTRLQIFAECLPYDPRRMWGWSFAQTVWCARSCSPGPFGLGWSGAAEAIWELRSEFRR